MNDVWVVIPGHNEFAKIRDTCERLQEFGFQNIIYVDDASVDDSVVEAKKAGVIVIQHEKNLGQGAGLRSGTNKALELGAKVIVHFDADGQHRPQDLARLIAPILDDKADVVLGSRFLNKTTIMPFTKKIVLWGGIILTKFFTGITNLTDTNCGLRAVSAQAAKKIEIKMNNMWHASEILFEIKKHNLRYCESPCIIEYDQYAVQKGQSWKRSFHILWGMIKLKTSRRYKIV